MNAKQAKDLSFENRKQRKFYDEEIERRCKDGENFAIFDRPSSDIIMSLYEDGYQISDFIDPFGRECIKIKW